MRRWNDRLFVETETGEKKIPGQKDDPRICRRMTYVCHPRRRRVSPRACVRAYVSTMRVHTPGSRFACPPRRMSAVTNCEFRDTRLVSERASARLKQKKINRWGKKRRKFFGGKRLAKRETALPTEGPGILGVPALYKTRSPGLSGTDIARTILIGERAISPVNRIFSSFPEFLHE